MSACAGASCRAVRDIIPSNQISQIANRIALVRMRGWTLSPTRTIPSARPARSVRRGNSAIRRVAIVGASAGFKHGTGSSSDANFCAAASMGRLAKRAASCQGSRSIRASNDTMLSGNPFRSSPIGANRKASNSDPRREFEAEGFMIPGSAASSLGADSADIGLFRARARNPYRGGIRGRPAPHRAQRRRSRVFPPNPPA